MQTDEENSQKVTKGLFDDYGILLKEKKNKEDFFEIISNTKIYYIKFC